MYGGDEAAGKSAGHELRSLNALVGCNVTGLAVPLMATIDYLYGMVLGQGADCGVLTCVCVRVRVCVCVCVCVRRGHRICAVSVLSIDDSTLVYGSADQGATINAADPELNRCIRVRRAAARCVHEYMYSGRVFHPYCRLPASSST